MTFCWLFHRWSKWKTVLWPSSAPAFQDRVCLKCGKTDIEYLPIPTVNLIHRLPPPNSNVTYIPEGASPTYREKYLAGDHPSCDSCGDEKSPVVSITAWKDASSEYTVELCKKCILGIARRLLP